MASIGEDYEIIGILLENDGVYPGDPQAFALSSYLNQLDGRTFHISMNLESFGALRSSPFCREIQVLWLRGRGITVLGEEILAKYKAIKEQVK